MNLKERLFKDEILQSYCRKILDHSKEGASPLFIQSAIDALGEQRYFALSLLSDSDPRITSSDKETLAKKVAYDAVTFLLTDNVLDLLNELKIPEHKISIHLPFSKIWISLESGRENEEYNYKINGWYFEKIQGDRLFVITFGTRGEERIFPAAIFNFGKNFSELSVNEQFIVRLSAFINSKLAQIRQEKLSRGFRRRNPELEQKEISVVTLRAIEDKDRLYHPTDTQRDYKYRWLVRGHFRAQWYPAEKVHRLIWIDNFIKGPEDKPLKHTVYKVAR